MSLSHSDVIEEKTYYLLKDLMGEEGFEEITTYFCSDTKQAIDNLRQAIVDRQTDYVGGICHKLKSSSKLIGAYNMAEISTELESYTDNKDAAKAMKLLVQLETEFRCVHRWIEKATADSAESV